MKGCWNIYGKKSVPKLFFWVGVCQEPALLHGFLGSWLRYLSLFFWSFEFPVLPAENFSNKPNSQQKKGWFWDPFFHGKMIWQSSNFATFIYEEISVASTKNSALNPNTEIRWVSFRRQPLTILYSHGNAEDPAAAMGWGRNWLKLRGFPLRGVQLLEAPLVVGTERNVEEWLRNWMCTGGCFRKKTMVQNETWGVVQQKMLGGKFPTNVDFQPFSIPGPMDPAKLQVDLKPGYPSTFESLGLCRTWVYIWTTLMPWRISQVRGLMTGGVGGNATQQEPDFWRVRQPVKSQFDLAVTVNPNLWTIFLHGCVSKVNKAIKYTDRQIKSNKWVKNR